jgi:hypothetical protein
MQLLKALHGKVKSIVKTKVATVFCEPEPFGFGFIRGQVETLDPWQIWWNHNLAVSLADHATMPIIHLVINVSATVHLYAATNELYRDGS